MRASEIGKYRCSVHLTVRLVNSIFVNSLNENNINEQIIILLVNARAAHDALHMACCHLASMLALTVSENKRYISNTDFHKLTTVYNHL